MKHANRPMRNLEQVAVDVLHCAISHEPNVCLLGNVIASEVAALAAFVIDSCPKCGATAWVNIDCDLCLVCSQLLHGEMP